jgi:uncharacterized membrane protein
MEHSANKDISRSETFSDGVFAIAITLLILEIKVPPLESIHTPGDLWHALIKLWPSYFAFVFSFGTILVGWVNHHRVFSVLVKSSRVFMYANGFLLLTITFLPFPTALLATYISTDYAQPAIVFFCIAGVLQNLGWNLLFYSLFKPDTLLEPDDIKMMRGYAKTMRLFLFVYLALALTAWWFPILALIINVSLWVLWTAISLRER